MDDESSICLNPASRHNEAILNFITDRVMLNQEFAPQYIDEAANRIFEEIAPYVEIFVSEELNYHKINFIIHLKLYILLINITAMFCANTTKY